MQPRLVVKTVIADLVAVGSDRGDGFAILFQCCVLPDNEEGDLKGSRYDGNDSQPASPCVFI